MKDQNKDAAFIESLRLILNERHGSQLSVDQAEQLYRFSDLIVDIATGKFLCASCKEEQQIFVIKK